jgi:tripartite ATP-independent transporter DctM subunit
MDIVFSSTLLAVLMLLFLGSSLWIFLGLLGISIAALAFVGFPLDRIGTITTKVLITSSTSWELSAVPLFVFMGEILTRSAVTDKLFRGLAPWVSKIPGKLLHTNVIGATIFAAISGTSSATTAAIARITLPALKERGYSRSISLGSLAGAGSFGLLIPPSVPLIVYGVQAEVSISKLFMAGLLPGLLMAALYSGYIAVVALLRPEVAPEQPRVSIRKMLLSLVDLAPVTLLIVCIIGAIYSGIATPSEAAAVGVLAAFCIAFRHLTLARVVEAMVHSVVTSAMIMSLIVTSAVLTAAMGYMHLPRDLGQAIIALDLQPYVLLLLLSIFFIILGTFMEGLSMMLMTLPFVLPMVVAAGFDPIWFGVYMIVMIELGAMTPPVALNLFVIHSISGASISEVARACIPFFLLMCAGLVIMTIWPGIATWLPNVLSAPGVQ